MNLYKDPLISLDYDVKTDILSVAWPDLKEYYRSEVMESFRILIETLKHYDIKRLLIDARTNLVELPTDEHYKLVKQLTKDFTTTRLQKMARLQSLNPDREKRITTMSGELTKEFQLNFVHKNFTRKEEAVAWLTEE